MGFWDYAKSVGAGAAGGAVIGGPVGAVIGAVGGAGHQFGEDQGWWGGDEADNVKMDEVGKPDLPPGVGTIEDKWTSEFDALAAAAQGRTAPMAEAAAVGPTATISERDQKFWRDEQMGLVDALVAQSRGEGGPSLAEMQMQRGLQGVVAGQRSMVGGAGGANRALAMRTAADAGARASQDVVSQSALLRAQEQQAARGQLAGVLQGARAADIDIAKMNAGFEQQGIMTAAQFQQQVNLANQGAELSMQQLNDAYSQYLMSQGFKRDVAMEAAEAGYAGLLVDMFGTETSAASSKYASDMGMAQTQYATPGRGERYAAMGLETAKTAAQLYGASSDERLKKNVKNADVDADEFLDALQAYSWEYKNKDEAEVDVNPIALREGRRSGVMAQDLQKTEMGKSFTRESEEGSLVVDNYDAVGPILASLSRVNDRIKELEGKKKKKEKK